MKNEEAKPGLATINEVHKSTYETTAKDYFEIKGDGLKVSTVKKLGWFLLSFLLLSTILPQIFSERHRQELAEEIRNFDQHAPSGEMSIPPIQDENKVNIRQNQKDKGRPAPSEKIKMIDLRAVVEPPPGAEVTAVLVSGGANGTVKARITENLAMNGDLYAQAGSILIGNGSSSDQRLYVTFSRLISPEGKSKSIFAQAYDAIDHIRGVKGKKVSDQLFKIGVSSALIFLSGMSESMQDQQTNGPFVSQRKSVRDAALGGVAQATSEHGRRMLDDLNNASQIEVQKETQIVVIFDSKEETNEKR